MSSNQSEPSKSTWEELVSGMRKAWSGNELAVHRPLLTLMLLVRAQQGKPNSVSFKEIDEPLREAIVEFGVSNNRYGSDLPFWHLQNAGFWEVEDKDRLPKRAGKDRPTRATLLKHDARGHVPPELWQPLTSDPDLIRRLACLILEKYWPKSHHGAILDRLGLSISRSLPGASKKG